MNNLDKIGKEIVDNIKLRIKNKNIIVFGKLYNSVKYIINDNNINIYINEYGKFVNNGTSPHYIGREGIKSIIKWSSKVGVNPWGVITNIRKFGTKPNPFLSGIVDDIDIIVKNNVEEYMKHIEGLIYYELIRVSKK